MKFIRSKNTEGKDKEEADVQNVHKLILTKNLYETESDWIFNFTLCLLEACCMQFEVPILVVKIMVNLLKLMINERRVKVTEEHRAAAIPKL